MTLRERMGRARCGILAAVLCVLAATPSWSAECWQGWGYFVDSKTLAFKSEQSLYVSEGPIDWKSRAWIRLHPVDPNTGRRLPNRKPVLVRPTRPVHKGPGTWAEVVEDVADVKGSKWSMMLRLSHIQPSPHSRTLNDSFSRWACGRE